MFIYTLLIIFILFCIFRFDLNNEERKRSVVPFCIVITCLILLSALSYRMGGDGINYEKEYSSYYALYDERFNLSYLFSLQNRLPGWVLLNSFCMTLSSSWVMFRIVFAIIFNGLVGRFIWKNSRHPYTLLLFFFILIYFSLNFEIMRGALAVAVFLYSLDFLKKKKWIKYYALCLLALSFHDSGVVTFLVPLLNFWKYNMKFAITFMVAVVMIVLFRDYLLERSLTLFTNEYLAMRVKYYVSQYETGSTFSLYLNILFNVLIPITILFYLRKKRADDDIMRIALAYILIYSISTVFPIGHRFNHFFVLFYYILIIEFLSFIFLSKKPRKLVGYVAICCMFVAFKARFYYTNYGETNVPTYVQYIPYTSVFEQTRFPDREIILDDAESSHY